MGATHSNGAPPPFVKELSSGVARGHGSSRIATQMEAALNDFAWRSFCSSLFDKYDKSHTGALNRDDMFAVFCDVTGSSEEARGSEVALRFMAAMDQDNDKAISRAEFRRCCRDIIVRQTRPGEAAAQPCTAAEEEKRRAAEDRARAVAEDQAQARTTAAEAFAAAMARSAHPLLQVDGARATVEGLSAVRPPLLRRLTSHTVRSVLVEVDDMRLTLLEVNVEAQRMVLALGVDAIEVEIAIPSRYAIGVAHQITMHVRPESIPGGGAMEMLDVLRALSDDVSAHTDVNAKKHMAFILGTLAQRFEVLRRSEAVGRFLKETLRRPIRELCGLTPMLPLGASVELMDRAERLRSILADEAKRLLTEAQEGDLFGDAPFRYSFMRILLSLIGLPPLTNITNVFECLRRIRSGPFGARSLRMGRPSSLVRPRRRHWHLAAPVDDVRRKRPPPRRDVATRRVSLGLSRRGAALRLCAAAA